MLFSSFTTVSRRRFSQCGLLLFTVLTVTCIRHFKKTPTGHIEALGSIEKVCLSPEELALYEKINEYRKKYDLPAVPLSRSLTMVAQLHGRDQMKYDFDGKACNMHSWGKSALWSDCCYGAAHGQAECMWSKPKEIAAFNTRGYEISARGHSYGSEDGTPGYVKMGLSADGALSGWKESSGHNEVIINRGTWKGIKWQAMGVGIYADHVNVWWAMQADKRPPPIVCENY